MKKLNGEYGGLPNIRYIKSELPEKAEMFLKELIKETKTDEKEGEWVSLLEMDPKSGRVKNNSSNVELILTSGLFKDIFVYDEFTNEILVRRDLPWTKIFGRYGRWQSNSNQARLMHYLGKMYELKGSEIVENAIIDIALSHTINRVKEQIKESSWDGQQRIDKVLIDFLGAEDNEYVRKVTRIMFVAAVKRVFEPGCKFDYMLVLVGEQGIRKSSLLEQIGGEFFSSGPDNLKKHKEVGEVLRNAWIVEIAELSAMGRSKNDEVKAFISKREDEYRRSYDRDSQKFPRKCIFVGTTNNRNFLRDETGNRRFWPVDLDKKRIKMDFRMFTSDYVSQLWAEAYKFYLAGQELFLDEEVEKMAHMQQESHFDSDPLEGLIEKYLNMEVSANWDMLTPEHRHEYFKNYEGDSKKNREKVCTLEIWAECLGKKIGSFNSSESKKIGELLPRLGWTPGDQKRARFKHYGLQKVYHIAEE